MSRPKTEAEKLLQLQRDAAELVTGWDAMEKALEGLEAVDLEESATPAEDSDDTAAADD